MRRPMVFCGVLFSLLLLLFLQLHPLWWGEEQKLSEKTAYIEGDLYEKEYRIRSGQKVLVFWLKAVSIYDVLPESDGKAGDSLPKEIPYCVMCYMKSGESVPRLGSRILVRGKIKNFRSATNAGEFDNAKYYQILGVGASVLECEVMAQRGEGSALVNRLYGLKEYAGLLLHAVLDEEDASVMGALLLGESALIDKDTKDLYKRSGIIHILAISGLHISLIGMGLYRLLHKCMVPTAICAGAASTLVLLFGWMTGFGPSSLRAVAMFILQMAAHFLGRTYDLPTGLSVSAILVLSMQPLYLYHSGFMLSFVSVTSLVILHPVCEDIFPGKLAPGMAIFIGTLPVHAWFYYETAPYALFLNLLVVPCMPVLMVLGGIVLLAGALWLPLTQVPVWAIHILLQFYRRASNISLKIPGNNWIIGKPAAFQVLLYLTLLVILALSWKYMSRMWCRMLICLAGLILVFNLHTGLEVISVDVSQGDCFFVTDHRGINLLIDGGSSSTKSVGEYQMEPVLKYNGVRKLDAVFISHLDQDHYNGILELIERSDEGGVGIGRIFVSEVAAGDGALATKAGDARVAATKAGDARVAATKAGDARVAAARAGDAGVAASDRVGNSWNMVERGMDLAGGYTMVSGGNGGIAAGDKLTELVHLATAHDIPVEVMSQGAVYRNGKVALVCLYPLGRAGLEHIYDDYSNTSERDTVVDSLYYKTEDSNENSMVLFMKYGDFTALFTGDLDKSGEGTVLQYCRKLLQGRPLTVLKVAHHGSKTSTSAEFLDVLKPEIAMISAGRNNSYGHPHEETLSRLDEVGVRVFRTDECGEITVRVLGDKVSVRGYTER